MLLLFNNLVRINKYKNYLQNLYALNIYLLSIKTVTNKKCDSNIDFIKTSFVLILNINFHNK